MLSHEMHQALFVFMTFFAMPASVYFAIRALQDYKEERTMESADMLYINRYWVDSMYGGPEEGGWWYDEYTPVLTAGPFAYGSHAFDRALEEARKWEQDYLDMKQMNGERPRHSVIGTADPVVLVEDHEARIYPEYTPHYE